MSEVAFDFEQQLRVTESRAARVAQQIMERHFEHLAHPRRDERDVLRLGFNRPIERRPRDVRTSQYELRLELNQARMALHARVFTLMATAPISDLRLGVLYAIADIIDVEHLQGWDPLWRALERQDWAAVMHELLSCNWDGLAGSAPEKKALFSRLITALVSDQAPEGLT